MIIMIRIVVVVVVILIAWIRSRITSIRTLSLPPRQPSLLLQPATMRYGLLFHLSSIMLSMGTEFVAISLSLLREMGGK